MDTDSTIVDSDSSIVDTHSNQREKVSTIASEPRSTINRNDCPRSIGMGVHDGSEYAAGLCTGVYLQKNGFETEILEMHSIAGGLATAWKRDGYIFENCIHWLVGSKEDDEMNATWKEVFDIGRLEFCDAEIYQVIEKGAKKLMVYRDVDRMEREFLAQAPEDAAVIREFAGLVRKLSFFRFPGGASIFSRLISLAKALPHFWRIGKYKKFTLAGYAERIKNPLLKSFFASGLSDLSFQAIAFSLAWMTRGNAGYPIGGSLKMIGFIKDQ